jgi:AAHS family 3-hydroxyphenylpropionic acid transporter
MTNAPDDRASARTIVFCVLGALCEGFDVQAAGIAAAGLSHELHPTPQALGLFFSASGAGLLIGALIGGRASDLVGRKAVLVASIAAFGICSLLTSVSPDMQSLIGARFLTGLGLGGAMPNLLALAADVSGPHKRSGSIATAYAGMPIGAVGGSLIVSAAPLEAWRVVFEVGGVAPLVVVPLMIRYLPYTPPAVHRFTSAAARRTTAIQALFGEGRAATTFLLWAAFFLIVLTLHLMLNWLPLLLMGRGLLKEQAAIAQAAFNVGGAATGLSVGVLLDSRLKRLAIGISLISLPIILLFMATCPPRPSLFIGLAFLLGGSILSEQVILYAVTSASYDVASRGTGMGTAVAVGRSGSLVGPLVAAALLAAGRSPSQVLISVLPIVVACGAAVGVLGWRKLAGTTVPPES